MILGNQAFGGSGAAGGGIWHQESTPVLINVTMSGKQAIYGGGMYNYSSSPVLTNVTISGNRANSVGGGMENYDSSPSIRNSVIWGNGPDNVYDDSFSGAPTPSYTYSLVEGLNPSGMGNLNGTNSANDPLFVSPAAYTAAPTTAGDYHLQAGSPAINKGSDGLYPANVNDAIFPSGLSGVAKAAINAALGKDPDGNTRMQGTAIDMGAYEAAP
jgi:hypothetical protein